MKNSFIIFIVLLFSISAFSQETNSDDRVNITQSSKPYIGVFTFGYQGLPTPGYPQFQLNNFGGIPGTPLATNDNSILGMFSFSGHDGLEKKTVGVIRVKSMNNFATNLSSRMDFLLGSNREQRMTILGDSGFVGIGTEEPTTLLDINGRMRMRDGAADGYVLLSDQDGLSRWADPIDIHLWDSNSDGNFFKPTGIVGIGTDNPSLGLLHIKHSGTNYNNGIHLETSSTTSNEDWYIYMNPDDNLTFNNDAQNYMALEKNTGSLGLGTTAPTAQLHLEGRTNNSENIIYAKVNYTGNDYVTAVRGESITGNGEGRGAYFSGGKTGLRSVAEATNSDEILYGATISASGSTSTTYGLQIESGDIDIQNALNIGLDVVTWSGPGSTRYAIKTSNYGNGSNVNAFYYAAYLSGNVTVTGTFSNPSDQKLKKNIKPFDNALDNIKKLNTKSYDYNIEKYPHSGFSELPQIGFIAQDLEKVFPHLVTKQHQLALWDRDDEGNEVELLVEELDYKGINYIGMIPILTQGIKEMDKKIEKKDQIIQDLQKENVNQDKEIAELKSLILEMKEQFFNYENGLQNCCFDSHQKENPTEINVELSDQESPYLEQNAPNPFNTETQIKYFLPSSTSKGQITIYDAKGIILKSISIHETGFGNINLKAGELPSGNYTYVLFIDGVLVDSKQMILIR